jgi:muramoyltetrapeptide carboxypeptidase LdcA involved in peptidoglycan recycling
VTAIDRSERTAERRAAELNGFLRDPEVRAVIGAIGGYTSNGVLDRVDWVALRRDPKILLGYSDLTALLLAATVHAEVVAFHGPTLLPELAEYPRPFPYTIEHLRRAVSQPQPLGRLRPAPVWTEEFLAWDVADDRARSTDPGTGWQWLCPGSGTGPLLGGNLETLGVLAGTRYLPDFTGAVLLWETTAATLEQVERSLTHLAMVGVFDRLAGVVVGRSFRGGDGFETLLRRFTGAWFADLGVPVIAGVDIGHADPMVTLPLGVRVSLDSSSDVVEVCGAGVA